jgi:DNA-binding transcriptional ArsR family regulator
MLDLLAGGEAPVGTLVQHARLSYSAVSQHLTVLLDAGLVRRRRQGRRRLYRVDPTPLRAVARWASRYERFWTERLDRTEAFFEEKRKRRRS